MSNELMFSDALLQPAPARVERSADAEQALAAIERLDAAARGDRAALERLRTDLLVAAHAVSEAKAALQALAIKPEGDADGKTAESGIAALKTAELGALLDELEHRLDVMTEAAGGPKRAVRPVPTTQAPAPQPAAAPTATEAPQAQPKVAPPAPEAEAADAPNSTPLPAISIDRVPTVSAVVSQLGRAIEPEEPARAAFLDTPMDARMPQTAAERGIPTVSMLEALVEALTAPEKAQAASPPAERAPESVLPDLELAARDWSVVTSAADTAPDRIEERALEISQSFAPDGEALGEDGGEGVALEIAFATVVESGTAVADPEQAQAEGLVAGAAEEGALSEEEALGADDAMASGEFALEPEVPAAAAESGADDATAFAPDFSEAALEGIDTSTAYETVAPLADAGEPVAAAEPSQPGQELLSSYARTEEFSYMPPEDVGTAVIFSAPHGPEDAATGELALGEPVVEPHASGAEAMDEVPQGGFREIPHESALRGVAHDHVPEGPALEASAFDPGDAPANTDEVQIAAAGELAEAPGDVTQPVNWPLAEPETRHEWQSDAAAESAPRFPRLPPAATHDPLAPLKTMSEEEKIALFS